MTARLPPDEPRRLRWRRAHIKHQGFCTCGKIVCGNGGLFNHSAMHERNGDGHRYLAEETWRESFSPTPEAPRPPPKSVAERLQDRLKLDPSKGCLVWQGYVSAKGYAHLSVGGVVRKAHRVAYELAKGPIPAGLVIDHLCRNPACCNPDHLEAVTQGENTRRGDAPSARMARQTHCLRGHPFSGPNLQLSPTGGRLCRACRQLHVVNRRQRLAATAAAGEAPGGHK